MEPFLSLKFPEVINMYLLPILSIHYPANKCENNQTYHVQDIILIKHQILVTNLQQNV